MKINQTGKHLPVGGNSESTTRSPASKTGSAGGGNKTAPDNTSVQLGTAGAQMRELESSIASAPVVDSQKVAEIKQAISAGRFQVNAEVVADRLIDTVKNLIATSAR